MAEPYLGEIRVFGFRQIPEGWAACDGSLLNIQQNQALYALLGIAFGGDGKTTFGLPDLRGRTPVNPNPPQGLQQGAAGGVEQVTLAINQVPPHSHSVIASGITSDRSAPIGGNCQLGATVGGSAYAPVAGATLTSLDSSTINTVGGGAHENMQPSLVVNFCIARVGMYPTRS